MKTKYIIVYFFLSLLIFIFGVVNIKYHYDDIRNKFYEIEPNLYNYAAAEILFISYERFVNALLKYNHYDLELKNEIKIKKSLFDSNIEIIKSKTNSSSAFFSEEEIINIIKVIDDKSSKIDFLLEKLSNGDINNNNIIDSVKELEPMLTSFQRMAHKIQINKFNDIYLKISNRLNKEEIYLILFVMFLFISIGFGCYHIVTLKKRIFYKNKVIKDKNIFISTIYHEISSPLQSIIMAVDLLNDDFDKQKNNDLLKLIKKLTDKVFSQTKEIFEYSKYEIGVVSLNCELFYINEITKDIEPFSDINHNKVKIRINEYLKKKPVYSDKNKLQKIITNIVDNSNKNTKNGTVLIVVKNIKNLIYIRIKDNGDGFDEKETEWLLMPFNQGSGKESKQGLGLGLTIVKFNIDLLDGKIKIKSKKGAGTSVMMRVPVNY